MRTITFLLVVFLSLATMVVAQAYGEDQGTAAGCNLPMSQMTVPVSGPEGPKGDKGDTGDRGSRGPAGKTQWVYKNGKLCKQFVSALQGSGYQTEGQLTRKFDERYEKKSQRMPIAVTPSPKAENNTMVVVTSPSEKERGSNKMGSSDMIPLLYLAGLAIVIAAIMVPSWLIAQTKAWKEVQEAKADAKAKEDAKLEAERERLKNAQDMVKGAAYLTDRQPNTESMSVWVTSDSVVCRVNPVQGDGRPTTTRRRRRPVAPKTAA